jgi:Caspase domain
MKTLILALLTLLGSEKAMTQNLVSSKVPVIVKSDSKTNWQIMKADILPNGFSILGKSETKTGGEKLINLQIDSQGNVQTVKEYPFSQISDITWGVDKSLLFVHNSQEKAILTKLTGDKIDWQTKIIKGKASGIAVQKNGHSLALTESEKFIYATAFTPNGKSKWQITFERKTGEYKSRIIPLLNENWLILSKSHIWILNEDGQTIEQFESNSEQIYWQKAKQLANGEIVLMGLSDANVFDDENRDLRIWGITPDGKKVSWEKSIKILENQELTYDFCESEHGELLFICQDLLQTRLLKMDKNHDLYLVYNQKHGKDNCQLKTLLETKSNQWTAIGNEWTEKGKYIVLQDFQQKIQLDTLPQNKPDLYMISIGVGNNLLYTKDDAEAMSNLYKTQVGKLFNKVHVQTLTADSSTKAGELAKSLELLTTLPIKKEDLLIIYFSGNGIRQERDYLLLGSDFNSAALRTTSVSMSQIFKDLDNIPCKKIILLDACQSGAAIPLCQSKNITIISASSEKEFSFEDKLWQHGAFTMGLLEGLNGSADINSDRLISINEIFNFVKSKVPQLVKQKMNKEQNPQIFQQGEEFVIFQK